MGKPVGEVVCPSCGKVLILTKYGKFPPHKHGAAICSQSSKRVVAK